MADQWYYTSSGQRCGPVSTDELRHQGELGRLQGHDLVWCERLPNWVAASSVEGLLTGTGNGTAVATATLPPAKTPLDLWTAAQRQSVPEEALPPYDEPVRNYQQDFRQEWRQQQQQQTGKLK